jgi:hypothetical protein
MRTTKNNIDLDGLRLIGLGRVPACAECPRYGDLVAAHHRQPAKREQPLASAPKSCMHAFCAPLARRYGAPARQTWDPRRATG